MGGYGSGPSHRRRTVEEALTLSTTPFRAAFNAIADGRATRAHGPLQWSSQGKVTSTIDFVVEARHSHPQVVVQAVEGWGAAGYPLAITWTQPHYGGRRWWWICPLIVDGLPCRRRVGKLYLPPGRRYFGCRHCYHLTYRSCQESNQSYRIWLRLGCDPEMARMIERLWKARS